MVQQLLDGKVDIDLNKPMSRFESKNKWSSELHIFYFNPLIFMIILILQNNRFLFPQYNTSNV